MRKKILTSLCVLAMWLLAAPVATAQPQGYEFTYQETMDIQSQLSQQLGNGPEAEAIAEFLSKRKSYYTLTYADGKSLFEKNTTLSDDDSGMGDGERIFVDFGNQEATQVINFFGRTFLIEDSLASHNWTFVDEQREIAGLRCAKALAGDSTQTVVWFSVDTPIPAGPSSYYGLPGLVAEVSIGPLTYTLTNIKLLDKNPKLKKPSKGKKVSRTELQEIMTKKMEQMGYGNLGGGGSNIQVISM